MTENGNTPVYKLNYMDAIKVKNTKHLIFDLVKITLTINNGNRKVFLYANSAIVHKQLAGYSGYYHAEQRFNAVIGRQLSRVLQLTHSDTEADYYRIRFEALIK